MVQLSISSAALLLVGLLGTASAATTCTVATTSGDAASNIAAAFESCKSGGTVSFPKGNSYTLKSMLSISGLQGTTVDFAGTINLGGYDTSLSGGSAYLTIKGDSITFAGGGTINGNGQGW
jgi:hypothetical protein